MGHGTQGLGVAMGVGRGQQQIGRQRQRGGALHAGAHATLDGQRIGMLHLVVVQQRQWPPGVLRAARGRPGFERQRRQVQGQPQHGFLRRWEGQRPGGVKTVRCVARGSGRGKTVTLRRSTPVPIGLADLP